jgi:hypothetical protein
MSTHQAEVPLALAVKLASLVVHAQEIDPGKTSQHFDMTAMKTLAEDPEIVAWLETFDPALLPEKRT